MGKVPFHQAHPGGHFAGRINEIGQELPELEPVIYLG